MEIKETFEHQKKPRPSQAGAFLQNKKIITFAVLTKKNMNAKVNVLPEFRNDSRGNLASAYESGLAKIFSYNGSDVTFRKNDGVVYVNATEMAKRFGKAPGKWIELPSAQEFIKTLSVIRKLDNGGIQTVRGGISGGGATWMHEDVAVEFARWLSPEFAIWCNEKNCWI